MAPKSDTAADAESSGAAAEKKQEAKEEIEKGITSVLADLDALLGVTEEEERKRKEEEERQRQGEEEVGRAAAAMAINIDCLIIPSVKQPESQSLMPFLALC